MKMNLNGYNAYTAVHNGGIYKATVRRTNNEYPFELRVSYVDCMGARHEEFCRDYKTASSAFAKLKRYFKNEEVAWYVD